MFLGYHLTHTHLLVWNWIELIWDPTWLLTDKGWYFPRRATWPSTSRVLGKPYVWGNSLADTYNVYIYILYILYISKQYILDFMLTISSSLHWSSYIIPLLGPSSDEKKLLALLLGDGTPPDSSPEQKKTSGDVSINGSHGTYDWYDCVWVIYYKKMADTEGLEIGMG